MRVCACCCVQSTVVDETNSYRWKKLITDLLENFLIERTINHFTLMPKSKSKSNYSFMSTKAKSSLLRSRKVDSKSIVGTFGPTPPPNHNARDDTLTYPTTSSTVSKKHFPSATQKQKQRLNKRFVYFSSPERKKREEKRQDRETKRYHPNKQQLRVKSHKKDFQQQSNTHQSQNHQEMSSMNEKSRMDQLIAIAEQSRFRLLMSEKTIIKKTLSEIFLSAKEILTSATKDAIESQTIVTKRLQGERREVFDNVENNLLRTSSILDGIEQTATKSLKDLSQLARCIDEAFMNYEQLLQSKLASIEELMHNVLNKAVDELEKENMKAKKVKVEKGNVLSRVASILLGEQSHTSYHPDDEYSQNSQSSKNSQYLEDADNDTQDIVRHDSLFLGKNDRNEKVPNISKTRHNKKRIDSRKRSESRKEVIGDNREYQERKANTDLQASSSDLQASSSSLFSNADLLRRVFGSPLSTDESESILDHFLSTPSEVESSQSNRYSI